MAVRVSLTVTDDQMPTVQRLTAAQNAIRARHDLPALTEAAYLQGWVDEVLNLEMRRARDSEMAVTAATYAAATDVDRAAVDAVLAKYRT